MKRPSRSHPPIRRSFPRRPPPPPEPTLTPWQRRAFWLRHHPFVVMMETAGLVGLMFAVGLFVYELRERQDERVARSWQLVTTPAGGNSGKRVALEYLNSQYGCLPDGWSLPVIGQCWKSRTPLPGIDLSQPSGRPGTYLYEVNLQDAVLYDANLAGAFLAAAKLGNSNLSQANLSNAVLPFANFHGAHLNQANLSSALISLGIFAQADLTATNLTRALLQETDFSYANLRSANLTGADLFEANFTEAKLIGTNLSGADFYYAYLDKTDLSRSWVYADYPAQRMKELPFGALAARQRGEPWQDFVDRTIRERPELGWTENMKFITPQGE